MFPYLPGSEIGNIGIAQIGGAAPAVSWWLADGDSAANCVAAYQAKGAASQTASYTNLANPGTYNATVGYPITWDAVNGWKGGGGGYLKTGLIPATDQTWSMFVCFTNGNVTGSSFLCGLFGGTHFSLSGCINPNRSYGNGSTRLAIPGVVTSGVLAFCGRSAYLNGSSDGTIAAGGGANALEIYILCRNNSGSPGVTSGAYIQALAVYSVTKDPTQMAILTAAMAAL